ncbi:MAG: hypothetical protein ACT4PZ_16530 [Panacagrimonas sp.]
MYRHTEAREWRFQGKADHDDRCQGTLATTPLRYRGCNLQLSGCVVAELTVLGSLAAIASGLELRRLKRLPRSLEERVAAINIAADFLLNHGSIHQ